MFAWAWSEARLAFIALGLATVLALLWWARRFREPGRTQLAVVAVTILVGSIALAALLPSTQVLCDCPLPEGAVRGCACAVDHHWPLRAGMIAVGVLVAGLLVLRARRQPSVRFSSTPSPSYQSA